MRLASFRASIRCVRERAGAADGDLVAAGTGGEYTAGQAARMLTCSRAAARAGGPERPPLPAPSQGRPEAGSIATLLSVLISDSASAPPRSAATATAPTSVAFGVSFTIKGLEVSGRRRSR